MKFFVLFRWARIRIWLNNSNRANAFRYEQYGDQIIIERTITHNSSTIKTYSDIGRKIGDSMTIPFFFPIFFVFYFFIAKREVLAICDAFNIQVSNPVCILRQSLAKTLLKQCNESEYYQFLMKVC